MNKFKRLYFFFAAYIVFVLVLAFLIIENNKADLHLWLNSYHSPVTDLFFINYTVVGAWIPYLGVIVLMFYKFRLALFVLVSQLLSALFAQIIKFMWNEPRPVIFFRENFPDVQLQRVLGEHFHTYHSFPSGHTTSAFAFFLALALATKHKPLHFVYLILAILVGYSRIYLSQHFALDVLVGSVIGVATTALCFYYIEKMKMGWADGSLRSFLYRKEG